MLVSLIFDYSIRRCTTSGPTGSPTALETEKLYLRRDYRPKKAAAQPNNGRKIAIIRGPDRQIPPWISL